MLGVLISFKAKVVRSGSMQMKKSADRASTMEGYTVVATAFSGVALEALADVKQ